MPFLTETLLSLFYTAAFIFLIFKLNFFEIEGLSKKSISIIFIVKLFFGLLLWVIYTYYSNYKDTADIYKYFNDSKILYNAIFSKPVDYFQMLFGIRSNSDYFNQYYSKMNNWYSQFDSHIYSDSHTIIRFNAMACLFSFGYFSVHIVFMNFFSLIGLTALYKVFSTFFPEKKTGLTFCIFLIPSVLFWGSGVLKEGLIFLGLGLLIYLSDLLIRRKYSLFTIPGIIFSILLLLQTKFYILVTILPALLAFLWVRQSNKRVIGKYMIVFFLFGLAGLNVERIFPGYDPLEILSIKQADFINLANGGVILKNDGFYLKIEDSKRDALISLGVIDYKVKKGSSYDFWKISDVKNGFHTDNSTDTSVFHLLWDMHEAKSKIALDQLEPNLSSFICNAPKALFNAMLRPSLLEIRSPLIFFPAVENAFLLLTMVFSLMYGKRLKDIDLNLVLFCLSFVLFLSLIIGITTPVMGAIVRYKVPALPFLAIAFLEIIDVGKLKSKFPRLGSG